MIGRAMAMAAGLALVAAPAVMAQDEAEGQKRERTARRGMAAHMMMDRTVGQLMDRRHELNLTDDQMSALADLRDDAKNRLGPIHEEMGAIRTGMRDGSLTREQAGDSMRGVHTRMTEASEQLVNRLDEILEPEQRQMLRQGRAQRGQRGRMRGRRGVPARRAPTRGAAPGR